MARTKISEFSATPGNNTDIDGINIAEGCAPSGINDAIRELMSQLKDFQAGTAGDSFNGPVGTTTAAAGAFTTLSASSTVSGTGFSNYLASPPAIGGTAAAAGSFTTLSASSTVTLSGGTANGVLYLNGSKVATSGSALTFDGTKLAVAGSSNSSASLVVAGANSNNGILQLASTGTAYTMSGGDYQGNWLFTIGGNYPYIWNINGSEQMRLTSTGLGVGTSSPAVKLDVNGSVNISSGQNLTWGGAYAANIPTMYAVSGANGYFYWSPRGNTGSYMTLDANSNLGLGVTPSAWGSGWKALQVNGFAAWSDSNLRFYLSNNSYFDGTNRKYIATGYASEYQQPSSGGFLWNVAASGTAGNAISFTQAMTLNASGQLSIGTTSSSGMLYAVGDSSTGYIQVSDGTGSLVLGGSGAVTGGGVTGANAALRTSGNLVFCTGGASERARIDSSGNMGIGTNSPTDTAGYGGKTLDVYGPVYARQSSDSTKYLSIGASGGNAYLEANGTSVPLIIYTSNTERARIDSSGNLLVGGTSAIAGERLYVNGSNANYINRIYNSNASPYGVIVSYTGAAPNGTANEFFRCDDTGALRMSVRSNGGIANFSANNVNLSDERTKTDIQDAGSYLSKICAIPVRTFKYKDQTDNLLNLGVIAQEVEKVAPELVDASGYGETPADGVPLKAIYQTDLQYALMKCIQELKAEVDSLKSQLKGA